MAKVLIGCRLPHGLILTVKEGEKETKATINGLNKAVIIGATHVSTEVDAEFWEAWKKANPKFPALKNRAIFQASNEEQANAKVKDLVKVPTGLEPVAPESHGVKTDKGK